MPGKTTRLQNSRLATNQKLVDRYVRLYDYSLTEQITMRKINLENTIAAGKRTIKEINQKLILNLIREQQPISRVEIARQTQLQRSTVTIITNRLLQQQWICEGESGRYGGGRRPKNLYLNTNRFHVLGVEVSKDETILALADLNGKLLSREYMKTKVDDSRFFVHLGEKIQRFSKQSRSRTGIKVAGVGVGLPGYIEKTTGRIIAAENFGWMDVAAGDYLRKRFDLPIYFGNTAKLAAFAEMWFAESKHGSLHNFVYVTTRDGLGTGIVLNGEIYNGARDGAAEFGHFSLFPDGERCVCGNYGCWELYASDMATVKRYLLSLNGSERPPRGSAPLTIGKVIERAHRGDKAACEALQTTAKYLGLGITNLVFGLNPERVIVGDELVHAWDIIGEIICSTVQSRVPSYYADDLKITCSSIKEMPSLLGAIALVLANLFSFATNP
jgi:predicted NBD/HSP70 family sugar kinase